MKIYLPMVVLLAIFRLPALAQTDADSVLCAIKYPQETHFKNIKQLTFGGDNAEAYWSFDDSRLIFQATNKAWDADCDQIFTTTLAGSNMKDNRPLRVSTGQGRTTCSYFMPGDSTILYASTHEHDAACPHNPPREINGNYVWPMHDSFDIYLADDQGRILKSSPIRWAMMPKLPFRPKAIKSFLLQCVPATLSYTPWASTAATCGRLPMSLAMMAALFFRPTANNLSSERHDPRAQTRQHATKSCWHRGL